MDGDHQSHSRTSSSKERSWKPIRCFELKNSVCDSELLGVACAWARRSTTRVSVAEIVHFSRPACENFLSRIFLMILRQTPIDLIPSKGSWTFKLCNRTCDNKSVSIEEWYSSITKPAVTPSRPTWYFHARTQGLRASMRSVRQQEHALVQMITIDIDDCAILIQRVNINHPQICWVPVTSSPILSDLRQRFHLGNWFRTIEWLLSVRTLSLPSP